MTVKPITGFKINGETQPVSYPHLHGKTAVEFTEQALTNEQKAQARTNIDVPSLDTLNAVETQLNGSISGNKKQIENLKKLAQGKIYDFETVTTSSYVKSVPTGAAPYAALKSIGGKSIVMNQYIKNPDFSNGKDNWSGYALGVTVDSGVCSINYPDGHTGHVGIYQLGIKYDQSHKYYVSAVCSHSNESSTYNAYITISGSPFREYLKVGTGFLRTSKIFSPTTNTDNGWIGILCNAGGIFPVKVRSVFLVDLTLMFGAGNEPATVEDFEAMFPAEYYEYNEGEIVSAEVQKVRSLGVNLFDIERFKEVSLENGGTVTDTTAAITGSTISNKVIFNNFKPNVRYQIKISATNPSTSPANATNTGILYSDGKTQSIFYDREYTTSSDASVVAIVGEWQSGVTTFNLNDCYIVPFEEGKDVEYKPYKSDTFVIPESVKQLEGYGWSAGSVCNSVDFERKKFIKRVGSVTLDGSQSIVSWAIPWNPTETSTGWLYPNSVAPDIKKLDGGLYPNMTCDRLIPTKYSNLYNKIDNGISTYSDTSYGLCVRYPDISLTTAAAINSFLAENPITVYYELAEPEEIDISEYLTDDNLIEVEQGGTLTFENIHGDSYRLPVPSAVEYMINIQEATA